MAMDKSKMQSLDLDQLDQVSGGIAMNQENIEVVKNLGQSKDESE